MPHTTFAASLAALLRDVFWKSLPVFAVAGLACVALRRASAAARHALWLLTLVGLLCLPAFCVLLPRWTAPILPTTRRPQIADLGRAPVTAPRIPQADATSPRVLTSQRPTPPGAVPSAAMPRAAVPPVATPPRRVFPPARPTVAEGVCLVWLVGGLLVLGQMLLGFAAASRLVRRCRPVTQGPLREAGDNARRVLGLTRPLSVRMGPVAVPMTCGMRRRPIVLLPLGAADWPTDRLRAVLLHEAAHVKRQDWSTMLLARSVCALYWGHPFVWLAARRLRAEAEGACDDLVLTSGVPAPDYAAHLLEIVRGVSSRRAALPVMVAMAHRSEVSGRLRIILDGRRPRGSVSRRGLVLTAVAATALLAPLAALRPVGAVDPTVPAAKLKADPTVQTVSWVSTTQFFDAHGHRQKSREGRPKTTWVRRDPPTIAEEQPRLFKNLIDEQGSFLRMAQGYSAVRHFPLLDGEKDAAGEVAARLRYCTATPGPYSINVGNAKSTSTPWRESMAGLDGHPVRLLTQDADVDILQAVKIHMSLTVHRWEDVRTGHLLHSEINYITSGFPGCRIVVTESNFRYNAPLPSGVFDWSPTAGLAPSVGFRRYVSRPLPDGTRYTFQYPTYLKHISQGWLDQSNQFITVRIDSIGTQPVPWMAVRGGKAVTYCLHGAGGGSWPAPHEEFISIVVGHSGEVVFPPGRQSIRRDIQWVGPNGSHHALAITDARTHLRFQLIHEDRYIPALFQQTDPVVTDSFRILPPGTSPASVH